MKRYESYQQLIEAAAQDIRKLVDSGSFPLSEIAVIYTMKKPDPHLPDSVPALVADGLDRQEILHKWLSEDYRAKRSHDITANSVTISTIHSVKGLDFACVFLIGLDALEPDERWTEKQINCLAYVGITRARYQLTIPYQKETSLISRLKRSFGGHG